MSSRVRYPGTRGQSGVRSGSGSTSSTSSSKMSWTRNDEGSEPTELNPSLLSSAISSGMPTFLLTKGVRGRSRGGSKGLGWCGLTAQRREESSVVVIEPHFAASTVIAPHISCIADSTIDDAFSMICRNIANVQQHAHQYPCFSPHVRVYVLLRNLWCMMDTLSSSAIRIVRTFNSGQRPPSDERIHGQISNIK